MKRIIVCGARDYRDYRRVADALKGEREEIELALNGMQTGADTFADSACSVLRIPKEGIRAKWREEGYGAGPLRNQRMLVKLLEFEGIKEVWAFHPDLSKSKGTLDMCSRAVKAGVPVRLYGKEGGWTAYLGSGNINQCPKCEGEKLLPALLAFRVRCKADFHLTGTIQPDIGKNN
jgi:hypothetical protein